MSLTPKQSQVFNFIDNFIEREGFAPTQRQIADHFGFRSLGTVQDYLGRLEQQGYLTRVWNGKRSLKIKPAKRRVPLRGRLRTGQPLERLTHPSTIEVPSSMNRESSGFFALEVADETLREEGICKGDYMVVREQQIAQNGDRVIACIDDAILVRRHFQHGRRIELRPTNSTQTPIFIGTAQHINILGVLYGVIRYLQ